MAKKSYSELLKDPRWQKKRLEVLEESNFECEECGDKSNTLHVHHGAYLKNTDPWDHPNCLLHCLCEKCHEDASKEMYFLKTMLGLMLPSRIKLIINIVCRSDTMNNPQELREAVNAFCELLGLDERILIPICEHMRYYKYSFKNTPINTEVVE